jgi:mannitol operon repressor
MRLADAEDLAKFVEELKRETDRGLPLVGAALIDDRLQETLRSFFCEGRTSSKLLDSANAPLALPSQARRCSVVTPRRNMA